MNFAITLFPPSLLNICIAACQFAGLVSTAFHPKNQSGHVPVVISPLFKHSYTIPIIAQSDLALNHIFVIILSNAINQASARYHCLLFVQLLLELMNCEIIYFSADGLKGNLNVQVLLYISQCSIITHTQIKVFAFCEY